jgi:hypothetical protein
VGSKNYWRGRKFKKAINHSESINFSNQKTGLYAVYLDQSTYTELRINKDGTFDYLTRDMQGIGSTYKGKWRTKGKTLSLKTPQKKDLFRSPIKTWLIKENELCEKYKHKIEPGVCLEYITPVKVISLND